jgi:hypothetical protein
MVHRLQAYTSRSTMLFCFAENHRLATDGRNVMSMLILLSSTEMCVLSIANVNTLVQPVKSVMFGDTTYNVKSQVNMSPKIFLKKNIVI